MRVFGHAVSLTTGGASLVSNGAKDQGVSIFLALSAAKLIPALVTITRQRAINFNHGGRRIMRRILAANTRFWNFILILRFQ